jgi:hypothetical protein
MNVAELFRRLSYGELANLAMGMKGSGSIEASSQDRLVHYTNEVLLRLHSRFPLREEALIVKLKEWVTTYYFATRYCESNPNKIPGDPIYIMDAASPYQEDHIKTMEVYHQTLGRLPLNDAGNIHSVYTPSPQALQVPNPSNEVELEVVYQCRHPVLAYGDLSQEIVLPPPLEGALTAGVGAMVYSSMNGPENTAKGLQLEQRYEQICREVQGHDLVNESVSGTNTKFNDRGFV